MFKIATLKYKLIGAGVLILACVGLYFYINHLNSNIDSLKVQKAELTTQVKGLKETSKEEVRREDVVKEVTIIYDKTRRQNESDYQAQIGKIDEDVTQGKDRPVGPLLRDYFNRVPTTDPND